VVGRRTSCGSVPHHDWPAISVRLMSPKLAYPSQGRKRIKVSGKPAILRKFEESRPKLNHGVQLISSLAGTRTVTERSRLAPPFSPPPIRRPAYLQ